MTTVNRDDPYSASEAPLSAPPAADEPLVPLEGEPTGLPRRLRFRRPGLSLAVVPGFLSSFLPYNLQARLVQGTVTRRVLGLAVPSVLEQSLVTVIGLVDAYIVGHLGAVALASVGLGTQVMFLVAALFGAMGVGGTALIARHIGAREPEESNRLLRQVLLMAVSLGLAAAVAALALAVPIMGLFGAAPDVAQTAATWLRVVSPSLVLLGVLLVGNAALRGDGDTRTPLVIMGAVNVVNVAVAWTLSRGLLGLPNLGVVGTAVGAAAGHSTGGLLVLAVLLRGRGHLRLSARLPRPDFGRLRRIINVGLPAGAEQLLLQLALLNMAAVISQFGTAAYAAHQVGMRIAAISYLPGWGFSVAATTLVGQELGARQPDRARQATHTAFGLALAVMTSMALVLLLFHEPILRLFTDDAEVIRQGSIVLRTSAFIQPIMAASFVFSGALRGAGDTRATMVVTVASVWGLRLLAAYLLGEVFGLGLLGAWLGMGLDFCVRAVLFWRRFRGGKWARLKV